MNTWWHFGFGLVVALAGCGGSPKDGDSAPVSGALTYYRDTKPIFDAKCTSCHFDGGIGPFDMTKYGPSYEYRALIKAHVSERTMPPWLAADGCADYVADRSLTDEQIETIAKWVDDGGEEGDAANEGKPLDTGPSYALSRVDLSMPMPVEYKQVATPDDYHCFVMDWPETAVKYVTGFRANPGNAKVVHHVIAFLATPDQVAEVDALDAAEEGPGYTCFGGAGFNASWLGSWAPGSQGTDFAPDTGLRVEPGSKVILQVHYNSLTAGVQSDRTTIDVRLADEVKREAWIQPWANPAWLGGNTMHIPAGEMGVTHSWQIDPTPYISDGDAITIYSASLHMHTLGKSASLEIRRQGGGSECLLDIPSWNFHWQGAYGFAAPKVFNPGDEIYIQCTWDNPTSKDVSWGEGTGDEMCLGGFYLTK